MRFNPTAVIHFVIHTCWIDCDTLRSPIFPDHYPTDCWRYPAELRNQMMRAVWSRNLAAARWGSVNELRLRTLRDSSLRHHMTAVYLNTWQIGSRAPCVPPLGGFRPIYQRAPDCRLPVGPQSATLGRTVRFTPLQARRSCRTCARRCALPR